MMNMTREDVEKILEQFHESFRSIGLSTIDNKGNPVSSYAPFIQKDNRIYIIISQVAKHYKNIKDNKVVSAILIEDESITDNIFFRKRLTYNCTGELTDSKDIRFAFEKQFGEFVNLLLDKMDFNIFELKIKEGRLVLGPGMAYEVDENNRLLKQAKGENNQGHIMKK